MTKPIRELRIFRWIYNIVFFVFVILYLPLFFMKGKHKKGFKTRLGLVPDDAKARLKNQKVLWVHAVSVGEMVQAIRLAALLKDRFKSSSIVLTTTTPAGAEVAEKLKAEEDILLYFPIDLSPCVRAFVASVNPLAVIVMETEIWPNLVLELGRRNIPLFIVNGRISDKAFPKYVKIKALLSPIFGRLAGVGAQDENMRFRFLALGADPAECRVTGNMKFDWMPSKKDESLISGFRNSLGKNDIFLLIAGSTHEGEESAFLDMYKRLKARFPALLLLLAPRHLNRLEAVEAYASQKEVSVQRFSRFESAGSAGMPGGENPVLVLDKMGLLAELYSLADLVFVGGSLVPVGGHNLVEPAFFEKAIIHGPHMNNFREMAAEFEEQNAALCVRNAEGLEKAISALINDEGSRRKLGAAAKNLIQRHQGATEKNVQLLAPVLEDLI